MDEKLALQLKDVQGFSLNLKQEEPLSLIVSGIGKRFPVYEGQTIVVPSDEAQVLETRNLSVMENIVVMPIPSNYGLVTYNGRTLTIT